MRLKLIPAAPSRQQRHKDSILSRGLSSAWTFAGNALFRGENPPLPTFDMERPNRIAAIAGLRKCGLLSSSIIDEVAFELERAYSKLSFAAQSAEKMCAVHIPEREEGKSLYVVPVILDTSIDHIVTFAFDVEENRLEYFDPQGLTILDREDVTLANRGEPKLVDIYLEMMNKFANIQTRVIENTRQIQTDVHSCGAYALRYVYHRAQGMSAENTQKMSGAGISHFRKEIDAILCHSLRINPASIPETQWGEGIHSEADFQAAIADALI